MQKYSVFNEIKLSQIKPDGWLKKYLEDAKNGLPGHLHEIGYPFNTNCWSKKSLADGGFDQWWPYEQTAYWIDAVVRSSMLLRDEEFYGIVKHQIDASLEGAENDGFIGPDELKGDGHRYQWPHAVYFRALYALYSATGDKSYLEKMARHYKTGYRDYSVDRDVANIETILRIYDETGDEELKNLAYSSYKKFNENTYYEATIDGLASDDPQKMHGVTFNEVSKVAAIMYTYFGEKKFIDAVCHGYERVFRDHMMPDGVHSSCEGMRGKEIMKVAHETCDISDFSWALGYLLEATGDAKYADRIEKACLNASLGAIGPGFKTLQYFSGVNQVIAARNSTYVDSFMDTPRTAYQPHQYPECCVGNGGRAIPNYISRMYYEKDNTVFAVLYGDCIFESDGFTITQSGNYPYGDSVKLAISGNCTLKDTIAVRIPGWAKDYTISYNDSEVNASVNRGFAYIKQNFADGDVIEIHFVKKLRSFISEEGGIYFEYGPNLMSLKIKERWEVDTLEKRQTKDFPAYNVYPENPWSYALSGNEEYTVSKGEFPIEIKLNARILKDWDIVKLELPPENNTDEGIDDKQVALGATRISDKTLELTPKIPSTDFVNSHLGSEEEITLVPYGCTQLRLTVFPRIAK